MLTEDNKLYILPLLRKFFPWIKNSKKQLDKVREKLVKDLRDSEQQGHHKRSEQIIRILQDVIEEQRAISSND